MNLNIPFTAEELQEVEVHAKRYHLSLEEYIRESIIF